MVDIPDFKVRSIHYNYGVWLPCRNILHAYEEFERAFEAQHGIKNPHEFDIRENLEEAYSTWREEKVPNSRWKRFWTGDEYTIVYHKVIHEKWSYTTRGFVQIMEAPKLVAKKLTAAE